MLIHELSGEDSIVRLIIALSLNDRQGLYSIQNAVRRSPWVEASRVT